MGKPGIVNQGLDTLANPQKITVHGPVIRANSKFKAFHNDFLKILILIYKFDKNR